MHASRALSYMLCACHCLSSSHRLRSVLTSLHFAPENTKSPELGACQQSCGHRAVDAGRRSKRFKPRAGRLRHHPQQLARIDPGSVKLLKSQNPQQRPQGPRETRKRYVLHKTPSHLLDEQRELDVRLRGAPPKGRTLRHREAVLVETGDKPGAGERGGTGSHGKAA